MIGLTPDPQSIAARIAASEFREAQAGDVPFRHRQAFLSNLPAILHDILRATRQRIKLRGAAGCAWIDGSTIRWPWSKRGMAQPQSSFLFSTSDPGFRQQKFTPAGLLVTGNTGIILCIFAE